MPVLSKSLRISKALYLGASDLLFKLLVLIMTPLSRKKAISRVLKAGFDPYGAWFLNILLPRNAFLFGSYEIEVKAFMRSRLRPGGICYDIGAAIGAHIPYAVKLVGPYGQVIAVEPNPANIDALRKMKEARKYDNLQIAPFALSYRRGFQYFCNNRSDFSYLGQLVEVKDRHIKRQYGPDIILSEKEYLVEGVRLDFLTFPFKAMNKRIDLVKIDIEGAEYEVLRDPSLYLENISALILELHYSLSSLEYREIDHSMRARGFNIFDITRHVLIQDQARGDYYAHHIFYVR